MIPDEAAVEGRELSSRRVVSNPGAGDGLNSLWSAGETAEFLGVPVATLYQWRYQHKGPRAYRVGRWLRYDPADVRLWLRNQLE